MAGSYLSIGIFILGLCILLLYRFWKLKNNILAWILTGIGLIASILAMSRTTFFTDIDAQEILCITAAGSTVVGFLVSVRKSWINRLSFFFTWIQIIFYTPYLHLIFYLFFSALAGFHLYDNEDVIFENAQHRLQKVKKNPFFSKTDEVQWVDKNAKLKKHALICDVKTCDSFTMTENADSLHLVIKHISNNSTLKDTIIKK